MSFRSAIAAARRASLGLLLLVAAAGRPAGAQRRSMAGARTVVPAARDSAGGALLVGARVRVPGMEDSRPSPAPFWAPVASLVVPGAGQAAMRQTRGVAYIAAEAYAWVQAREFRRDENRRRSESRRRAREVARLPGAIRDTSGWGYYEALEEYVESGPFSVTTDGTVTPPTDVATYNGRRWIEAQALYADPQSALPPSDPRYQRALAYYVATAVPEEFRWTWRNRQIEWLSYQADIARENQLSREFTMTLVVIGANHLVSAIDALASVRLRQSRGPQGERRIEATVPLPAFGKRPPRRP